MASHAILSTAHIATFFAADGSSVAVEADRVKAAVVDRAVFDQALADSSRAAGVEIRCGSRVRTIDNATDRVTIAVAEGETVEARACVLGCGASYRFNRQLGLGVSRIVIDPGHGGKDPGAPGSKTTEASVVLDVALRVEKILAAEAGVEVVLTRRTDTFVPARGGRRWPTARRPTCSSRSRRSSRNRKAAGVETYILNFASNTDAAAVAARAEAAAARSMRSLPDMVRAIQGNKRDDHRQERSESMVTRLRPHSRLRDLGVKQAPFVV